jgi:hypothetical protein
MDNQRKIHLGEVYTVKDVEDDNPAFIGAEIKVYWTRTSFAQMTLASVTEDDYGFPFFSPVGTPANGGAMVRSDMRVEILDIKDKGMPTAKGAVVRFGEGSDEITFFAESAPWRPGDEVFRAASSSHLHSWTWIKEKAAGRPIYVAEPSWEKIGE